MNQLTQSLLNYYPMLFKPVTRYTRAGQHGKYIQCPKCKSDDLTYMPAVMWD